MKKIISLLLVLSIVLTVGVALTSCGAPEDAGAEIAVYLGNGIYDFDPTDYYVDSNAEQVLGLLYEPLFRSNNGKLECALADSYEVDREKREIKIKIRESYWSNGTRINASDFLYSWSERLLNPNNANPAAALLYDIENAAAIKSGVMSPADLKVEASGIYELTITYREGADYHQLLCNLASVATAPVRQSAVDQGVGYWSKDLISIVTNGPFKLSRYNVVTGELHLERNKGYHQNPGVENYTAEVTPGTLVGFTTALGEAVEVSYADIEGKTVFYLQDAPLSVRADNKNKATVSDDTSVYTYVFNTENPLFAIAEVRVALSMAIDRDAIAAAVTFGKAANGFIPDAFGGSSEALISTSANINGAKQLLNSVDFTGIDKSFTITVQDDEESIAIANLVKASWQELGFTVNIYEASVIETVLSASGDDSDESAVKFKDSEIQALVKDAAFGIRNFDVIAVDWQTYSDDAFVGLASFSSHLSGNGKELPVGSLRPSISGWSDSDYDNYVSAAFKSEGEDRADALAKAEAYLAEAMPVCPILFNESFAFVSAELSKVDFDDFGNVIFTKVEQKNYKSYLNKED